MSEGDKAWNFQASVAGPGYAKENACNPSEVEEDDKEAELVLVSVTQPESQKRKLLDGEDPGKPVTSSVDGIDLTRPEASPKASKTAATSLCVDCGQNFDTPFQLMEHRRLHTGERPHKCPHCDKMFCHLANFEKHMEKHKDEVHQCSKCKKTFSTLRQMQAHNENACQPFKCSECTQRFCTEAELTSHLTQHNKEQNYKCPDCGKKFRKPDYLKKHQLTHSKNPVQMNVVMQNTLSCTECKRCFKTWESLRNHKCDPKKIHCYACGEYFGCSEQYLKHKVDTLCPGNSTETLKKHTCPVCGVMYNSSGDSGLHKELTKSVVKCADCRWGFKFPCKLVAHQLQHSHKSKFECGNCGRIFGSISDFWKHSELPDCKAHQDGNMDKANETKVEKEETDVEEGQLKCFDCGKFFEKAELLHHHYMLHAQGEL
ncbi:zinc finger protein 737-like isoform X2 [Erpetoichthys calabaricus]|nr:zinc finger protein 737-like isoform X2 [Erpetoichthys calabaricus]